MPIKTKTQTINLTVDPAAHIILSIGIGDGQIGGNVVKFQGGANPIKKGEISKLDLGLGSDIKGKTLVVVTNILDVNSATMNVSATYDFVGCTPEETVFKDAVDNAGDIYSLTNNFIFN